jgi:hypothetical protein
MPVSLWQFDRRGGPNPAGTVGQLQLPDNAIDTKDEPGESPEHQHHRGDDDLGRRM